jgi:hypothetical protein
MCVRACARRAGVSAGMQVRELGVHAGVQVGVGVHEFAVTYHCMVDHAWL